MWKASSLAVERLRMRGAQFADDFRRADRFFKLRLAIVSAWAILSVATLWGACSTGGAGNPLGADVQLNRDSIMGAQLLVRNESKAMWEDVVLTLDDGWTYAQDTMRPNDLVVLSVTSFRKGDLAPPRDYVPRSLALRCDKGMHRFELR